MSHQNPFSRLKKKLKRRLAGGRDESEIGGADAGEDRIDEIGSLPQLEPPLTTGGGLNHPQARNEAGIGGGRVDSTGPLPQSDDPGFVLVSGSGHNRGRRGAVIEGVEGGKRNPHLRPSAGDVVESGPSQGKDNVDGEKVDRVNLPLPEGTQTTCLSAPVSDCFSDNINNSAIPDHIRQAPDVDEGGHRGVVDENKSSWKSSASATAKSILRTVKESQNAYPPLKSIAEGLYLILNSCNVCPPLPADSICNAYCRNSIQR